MKAASRESTIGSVQNSAERSIYFRHSDADEVTIDLRRTSHASSLLWATTGKASMPAPVK